VSSRPARIALQLMLAAVLGWPLAAAASGRIGHAPASTTRVGRVSGRPGGRPTTRLSPRPGGLGATVAALRTHALVRPTHLATRASRRTAGAAVRAATRPGSHDTLATSLAAPLAATLRDELGVDPGRYEIRVSSRRAFFSNASADGSVILADADVSYAADLGAILATTAPARTTRAIFDYSRGANPPRLGALLARPLEQRGAETQRLARDVLTHVLGHELSHVMFSDGARVQKLPARQQQAHELRADLDGVELALRAGSSPRAIAAFPMVLAAKEALRGGVAEGRIHPEASQRYRAIYERMTALRDRRRPIYRAGARPRRGAPYFSAAMKAELAALPSPEAFERELSALAAAAPRRAGSEADQ
jgi:hypothetical protein